MGSLEVARRLGALCLVPNPILGVVAALLSLGLLGVLLGLLGLLLVVVHLVLRP